MSEINTIVVKVGSSTITHSGGGLDLLHIEKLVRTLSDFQNMGKRGVLVSSGAVAVGVSKLGLDAKPKDTPGKQAAAAVGQCELMYTYDKLFSEYLGVSSDTVGLTVGNQIYLRASSASIISDLVHEGNHAIEYISGINVNNIRTWPGEIRAYKAEREFQIKTKREVTFKNENDLLVHVWSNYEREVK